MRAAQAQTTKPTWCMNMMQIHVDRNMSLVTASQACTPRFSDATHIVLFGWCLLSLQTVIKMLQEEKRSTK